MIDPGDNRRFTFTVAGALTDPGPLVFTVSSNAAPRFVARLAAEYLDDPIDTLRLEICVDEVDWIDVRPDGSDQIILEATKTLRRSLGYGLSIALGDDAETAECFQTITDQIPLVH